MRSPWDAIAWWELRRVPFNLVVGSAGLIGVALLIWVGGQLVSAGEDAVEPMLLFVGIPAYGIAANAFYTLGWASELLWTGGDTSKTAQLRERIFRLGLALSVAVTLFPIALVLCLWAIFGIR